MSRSVLKTDMIRGGNQGFPAPKLRSVVRKSALLNLSIVLTSCPVLLYAGGPKAVVPILKIMIGISVLIWGCTFAVFSLVSLVWIYGAPASTRKPVHSPLRKEVSGVADRWLDGPS